MGIGEVLLCLGEMASRGFDNPKEIPDVGISPIQFGGKSKAPLGCIKSVIMPLSFAQIPPSNRLGLIGFHGEEGTKRTFDLEPFGLISKQ